MAVEFLKFDSDEAKQIFRKGRVGASEVGAIVADADHKYISALELFEIKTGISYPKEVGIQAEIGLMAENLETLLWENYDKDEYKFKKNLRANKRWRIAENVDEICINSSYPNMCASLDRKFYKDGKPCALELKSTTSAEYNSYKNCLNPSHVLQLATQLLLTTFHYGEIFYWIDKNKCEVFPMTYEDALSMEKLIVSNINDFWKRVEKAKVIMNQIAFAKENYQMEKVAQLQFELHKIEPDVSTSNGLEYRTQRYTDKQNIIPLKGNDTQLELAKKDKKISEQIKKLTKQQVSLRCDLVNSMEDKLEIDFGKLGKVNIAGKFQNKIK